MANESRTNRKAPMHYENQVVENKDDVAFVKNRYDIVNVIKFWGIDYDIKSAVVAGLEYKHDCDGWHDAYLVRYEDGQEEVIEREEIEQKIDFEKTLAASTFTNVYYDSVSDVQYIASSDDRIEFTPDNGWLESGIVTGHGPVNADNGKWMDEYTVLVDGDLEYHCFRSNIHCVYTN